MEMISLKVVNVIFKIIISLIKSLIKTIKKAYILIKPTNLRDYVILIVAVIIPFGLTFLIIYKWIVSSFKKE